MKFRENEDAVSPVIGVILMVAITVILAAVIAAFVFGMSGDLSAQKEVYVTVTQGVAGEDAVLRVTIQGGKDVSALTAIQYKVGDDAFVNLETGFTETPFGVGDSGTITVTESGHYVFRGVFTDNSVKILAERDYVASAEVGGEGD